MTTVADLQQFCKDRFQASSDDRVIRIYNRAIVQAHEFISSYDFPHYRKEGRINTALEYIVGTLAITEDDNFASAVGSASWSSGFKTHRVLIGTNNDDFEITSTSGSTRIIFPLDQIWNNPTETSKSYKIFKDKFALPSDCRKIDALRDEIHVRKLTYIPPERWKDIKLYEDIRGEEPIVYTTDGDFFYLYPYPTSKNPITFWYYRWSVIDTTDATATMDWDENALTLMHNVLEICVRMNDTRLDDRLDPLTGESLIFELCKKWRSRFANIQDSGENHIRPAGQGIRSFIEYRLGEDD